MEGHGIAILCPSSKPPRLNSYVAGYRFLRTDVCACLQKTCDLRPRPTWYPSPWRLGEVLVLLLIAAVLGTLGGLWHGGALAHFARLRLRWPLLFLIGLVLRAVAFSPPVPPGKPAIALYVLALAVLCGGMLLNRRIVGIELVLVGLALNASVILANGGAMPVTADALRLVGRYDFALQLQAEGPIGHVRLATPDTRLHALADIIPLSPLPSLQIVASAGDLFIAAGLLIIFYVGTLRPPDRARDARPEGEDPERQQAADVVVTQEPVAAGRSAAPFQSPHRAATEHDQANER